MRRVPRLSLLLCLATALACSGDMGDDGRDGDAGARGADGLEGAQGPSGTEGTVGADGLSCTVEDNGDGTKTVSCEDGTTAVVSDGSDGMDGDAGVEGEDGQPCSPEVDPTSKIITLLCPGSDPVVLNDSDEDGVADGNDQCPGFDDAVDADSNGVPDDCDRVYLYASAPTQGGFATRSGADSVCVNGLPRTLRCDSALAVVSFPGDSIAMLPSSYDLPFAASIRGPTGIRIGDNWADVLDNSIVASLNDAEVFDAAIEWQNYYWTGSTPSGGIDNTNNCVNWTSASASNFGFVGASFVTTGDWLDNNRIFGCNSTLPVMCACWLSQPTN